MNKAIKVRIYPTPEQAGISQPPVRCLCVLRTTRRWHIIQLTVQTSRPEIEGQEERPQAAVWLLRRNSRKYHWLKDFDSIALQQACINLDKAFQSFFDPKLPSRLSQVQAQAQQTVQPIIA